jgi:serine protease Do
MNRSIGSWKPFFLTMVLGVPVAYWLFSHPSAPPTAVYAQQVVDSQQARGGLVDPTGVASADQLSKVFRDVSKLLKPSVVSIKNVIEQSAIRTRSPRTLPIPKELEQFFGNPSDGFSDGADDFDAPKGRFANGLGSGVIVRNDGYILTNNHVVEGASILEIVLSDDRKFNARVIGTDRRTDLAILKIDATGLVPAKLGNSESMEVGDWVIAIGSPFGLAQTVTAGIVSATNRSDQGITPYDNFIQTDAAINPGNSGGPLLNLRGEVIGINTAIASSSGGYNGICFAVPSDIAKRVLDDLINNGRVTRGVIGIEPMTLNAEMARKLSLPDDTRGALVASVTKDFPAYNAGLKKGDVITAINGTTITSDSSMRRFVGETKPGTPVRVAYLRNGKRSEVAITVGEMDERALELASTNAVQAYGVTIGPASDETIQELGLKPGEAVEVARINRGSPLADEMAPGMAILSVNGKKTGSPIEFAEALQAASATGLTKIVIRDSEGDRTVRFRTR